jgi:hypothetical protein
VAQGTLLGPLIFPAVIDSTAWDVDSRWKYVDILDLETSAGNISAPQLAADNMWVQPSRTSLTLARNPPVPWPLPIAGQELQVLDNVKILGVIVQKDPQWSEQVASMATKCSNIFVFIYPPPFSLCHLKKMTCATWRPVEYLHRLYTRHPRVYHSCLTKLTDPGPVWWPGVCSEVSALHHFRRELQLYWGTTDPVPTPAP